MMEFIVSFVWFVVWALPFRILGRVYCFLERTAWIAAYEFNQGKQNGYKKYIKRKTKNDH